MQNFFNADVVIFNKQSKPMHGFLEFSELGSTVPLNVMNPLEGNLGNIIITDQFGKPSGTGAGTGVSQILLQDKNYTVRYYEFIGTIFDINDPSQFELIRTLDYFASNYKSEFDNELGTKVTLENMLDLRNFDPSDSSYVELIGYYKPFDMWKSTYKFEPFSTHQDDGGSVIKSSLSEYQNGRWILVDTRDQIDVKQFGIKSGEECSVQLLNAFNYCNEYDRELVFTADDGWTKYVISGGNTYECPRVLAHKNAYSEFLTDNVANTFKINKFRRVRDENNEANHPFFRHRTTSPNMRFYFYVDEICTDDVEDCNWISDSSYASPRRLKVIVNDKKDFHRHGYLDIKKSDILLNKDSYSYRDVVFSDCVINKNSKIKCFDNSLSYVRMNNMVFEAKYFANDFNYKDILSLDENTIVTLDNCKPIGFEQRATEIYLTLKDKTNKCQFESFKNLSVNKKQYIKIGYNSNRVVLQDIKNPSNNIVELQMQPKDDDGVDYYVEIINCENIEINCNGDTNFHLIIVNSTVRIKNNIGSLKAVDSTIQATYQLTIRKPKFLEIINCKINSGGAFTAGYEYNNTSTYTAIIKNSEFRNGDIGIFADHLTFEENDIENNIIFKPTLNSTYDGHPYYQLFFNRNKLRGVKSCLLILTKYDERELNQEQDKVKVWLEVIGNTAISSNNIIVFKDKRVNLYDDTQHIYRYENNICNTKQNGYESTVPFYFWVNDPPETNPEGKNGLGIYAFTDNNNPQVLTQFGNINLFLIKFTCGINFDVDVKLEFIAKEVNGVLEHSLSSSVMKLKMWSYPKTWKEYRTSGKLYTYHNDRRLIQMWDYSQGLDPDTSSVDLYRVKMNRVVGFNETDVTEFRGNVKWGSFMIDLFAFNTMSASEEPFNVHCKLTVL